RLIRRRRRRCWSLVLQPLLGSVLILCLFLLFLGCVAVQPQWGSLRLLCGFLFNGGRNRRGSHLFVCLLCLLSLFRGCHSLGARAVTSLALDRWMRLQRIRIGIRSRRGLRTTL